MKFIKRACLVSLYYSKKMFLYKIVQSIDYSYLFFSFTTKNIHRDKTRQIDKKSIIRLFYFPGKG